MYKSRIILLAILLILLTGVGEPVKSADITVTLVAVGDVFFARGAATQVRAHGFDYPFELTSDLISSYDLAFCNLECALSDRGSPMNKRFVFRGEPDAAGALRDAGFDVICLGNNHVLDYGNNALKDTIESVEGAGLMQVGTRIAGSDDSGVRYIDKNGLRIGFLAYTDVNTGAGKSKDGNPEVMQVDEDLLPCQVNDAKATCDTLVVSMHWGIDYVGVPTERQRRLAEICIDNGADLILGHHPHVLQATEVYKGKPIIYSMGGFVFDSNLHGADNTKIYVYKLGIGTAELSEEVPIRIVNCRPEPME